MFLKRTLFILLSAGVLSSCATIVGGSKYNASIEVDDHPQAKIYYKDKYQGSGMARFKVKRSEADKFVFTVKQDGCETQSYSFTERKFRTGAFICSILFFSGSTSLPLPYGGALDLITGAVWKPDNTEFGVTKQNYKNYRYTVDYTKCDEKKPKQVEPGLIVDVIYLKNGGIAKGTIVELVESKSVKIKTLDGGIFSFDITEVEKMTKEVIQTASDN